MYSKAAYSIKNIYNPDLIRMGTKFSNLGLKIHLIRTGNFLSLLKNCTISVHLKLRTRTFRGESMASMQGDIQIFFKKEVVC